MRLGDNIARLEREERERKKEHLMDKFRTEKVGDERHDFLIHKFPEIAVPDLLRRITENSAEGIVEKLEISVQIHLVKTLVTALEQDPIFLLGVVPLGKLVGKLGRALHQIVPEPRFCFRKSAATRRAPVPPGV